MFYDTNFIRQDQKQRRNGETSCDETALGETGNNVGMVRFHERPGPEVIKLFSCSTQLSMEFFLLINVKMPTIVGILTFMSGKNSILGLSELKTSRIS